MVTPAAIESRCLHATEFEIKKNDRAKRYNVVSYPLRPTQLTRELAATRTQGRRGRRTEQIIIP